MTVSRRTCRRLVAVGSIAAILGAAPAAALAAKTSTTKPSTSSLAMTSETFQSNPNLPGLSCMTEDYYDHRDFSGSLAGSYSTAYQLCDLNRDGYTAGGIGLQSKVTVVGQLSDLAITAPDGTVHHAVPTGQTTYKGVTSYTYSVCYVPLYYISTNTGSDPLPGGSWHVNISGQLSSVSWVTNALMTDVNYQQTYCPGSEQNLA